MSEDPERRPRSLRQREANRRRTEAMASAQRRRPARSAPISIPSTHVRRTPSEAQLARANLRAECKDDVMYCLLMTGIIRQVKRRGDVEHLNPLSRKSIVNIVRTKEASDRQLEHHRVDDCDDDKCSDASYIPRSCDETNEDDSGWEMYSCTDRVNEYSSFDSLISSSLLSRLSTDTSLWTLVHDPKIANADEEDDCIFSLEM